MATFEINVKHAINVQGEFVVKCLSIQITTMMSNPFDEVHKIDKAFQRIHSFDLKKEGDLEVEMV